MLSVSRNFDFPNVTPIKVEQASQVRKVERLTQ